MDQPVSILKLTSAMARHAAHAHQQVGDNLARADIPGAKAGRVEGFAEALRSLEEGSAPRTLSTHQAISIEREMIGMAEAKGRHDAATTAWKSALNMMRLAVRSPE